MLKKGIEKLCILVSQPAMAASSTLSDMFFSTIFRRVGNPGRVLFYILGFNLRCGYLYKTAFSEKKIIVLKKDLLSNFSLSKLIITCRVYMAEIFQNLETNHFFEICF